MTWRLARPASLLKNPSSTSRSRAAFQCLVTRDKEQTSNPPGPNTPHHPSAWSELVRIPQQRNTYDLRNGGFGQEASAATLQRHGNEQTKGPDRISNGRTLLLDYNRWPSGAYSAFFFNRQHSCAQNSLQPAWRNDATRALEPAAGRSTLARVRLNYPEQ